MAGTIKEIMDLIIAQRSQGSAIIARLTKAKLAMKGFNYDQYTNASEDDPLKLENLRQIAHSMNVKL